MGAPLHPPRRPGADSPPAAGGWLWTAALALGLPAVLYLATLYPGIGDRAASGDAVELQYVGRALSIPHEPGYPQYVFVSFLWSWLPLPLTVAAKINLLSAVFAIAAGGFLFAAARSLCGHATATVLSCWALLTAPDLWLLATQAEVYTLHALWVTVFFWAALRWRRSGERRHLVVLLFAYALAFGNHLTMVTLLPALVFLLLDRQPRLVTDLSAWGWAAAAAAAGAGQYLLLVWRSYFPHPSLLERFPLQAGPREILAYVTGDRFVDKHWLAPAASEWTARAGDALVHGAGQLTPLLAALAVYGLIGGWRRQPGRTSFLFLAALSVLLFAASYGIRDWLLYCIPAWVAAALLAADGLARLTERLPRLGLAAAVVVGLLLAPRIVRGVDELRVAGNPADLTGVLPALPAGSRVIPAGGKRLTRLHENYYRYGEGLEAAGDIRFLSARQDLLHKALHLRGRSFFFRSPTVVKILGGRLIDYRVWPEWRGPGDPLLVTGTDRPLAEIEVRRHPGPALELIVRADRRVLNDEKDLYLFFVGARDGRAKGLEPIAVQGAGEPARLRRLLAELPAGDLVVLLVPRLRESSRPAIAALLAAADLEPLQPRTRSLVAAWRHRFGDGAPRLWQDPRTAVTLKLGEL